MELGRAGIGRSAAVALCGAGMIAAATVATAMLSNSTLVIATTMGRLGAVAVALSVVVPALVVLASYARVRVSARTIVAASAIGVLTAGVVTVAAVPLLAFIAMVQPVDLLAAPVMILTGMAVIAAASVPARVLAALDPRARAVWISRGFVLSAYVAFIARLVEQAS